MQTRTSTAELARIRVECADRLEAAIGILGEAYRAYTRATSALEFRCDVEFARYLETPIVVQLSPFSSSLSISTRVTASVPPLRIRTR